VTEGIVITTIDDVAASIRSDRDLISVLGHAFDGRPDSWESIGSRRATYRRSLVAKLDGRSVGLAMGQLQPEELEVSEDNRNPYYAGIEQLEALTAGTWFLSRFAVRSERRRLGVGSLLLLAAELNALECGAKAISLIVPLPDAPDPGPNPPVKGYALREERRADTVPFLERRGYVKRASRHGFHSLGEPVTNQLMTKELADG
jgi:GNAT superfamily N-acetyltransferase